MSDYEKLYLKAMNRIAELEAAQQWHPASEPPKNHGWILVLIVVPPSKYSVGEPHVTTFYYAGAALEKIKCTHWRDLPTPEDVK